MGPDHGLVLSLAYHLDLYKSNFKIPVSLNSYAQNIQIHTHTHTHTGTVPTTVGQKMPSSLTEIIDRQGNKALWPVQQVSGFEQLCPLGISLRLT